MIALVAGEVAVRRPDHVVIETASGVGYHVAVLAYLGRYLTVLKDVEEHHLAADECPRHIQRVAEVEEHVPERVNGGGQRGKLDRHAHYCPFDLPASLLA